MWMMLILFLFCSRVGLYLCAFVTVSLTEITCSGLLRLFRFILYLYTFFFFFFWPLRTVTTFLCAEPFEVHLNSLLIQVLCELLFLYWFTVIVYRILSCHSKIWISAEWKNYHLIKLTNSLYIMSVVIFCFCFRFIVY